MRVRELSTIYYRPVEIIADAHGGQTKQFSELPLTLIGSIRPEVLYTDVKGAGSVITGNVIVYVPKTHNPNFDIKVGDGFYLEGEDPLYEEPTWFVSNRPFPYIKHYLLVLKNKVE